MSLSTGTYVSQFVSHPQTTPEPAVNRPTMTQDRRQLAPCTTDTVRGVTGAVTESEASLCLALLGQGKWALRCHTEIFW